MPIVSGGSGGSRPISCVLAVGALDIHAPGNHPLLWSAITDNVWDANPLVVLPAGLGITTPADGSTANLTTTAAGTWAFTLFGRTAAADASIRGILSDGFGGGLQPFGPVQASRSIGTLAVIYALPTGAVGSFTISTDVAAAANPLNTQSVLLEITRLA